MDKNHNVGLLLALSFLLHISYLYAGTSYEAYEAAPQIVVRGVVTDVGGEPLIGAAVQNVRKKSGVVTDLNGQFEIRTSVGEKWTVSYIGMKPYEFVVKSEKKLRIVYNPQIQISAESGTKRSIFRQKNKTKRSKKRLHTTLIKPEQKVNEDLCSGFIVS